MDAKPHEPSEGIPEAASWWRSLPGIVTATGGLVTAIVGLVAVLNQSGVFGQRTSAPKVDDFEGAPVTKSSLSEPPEAPAGKLARRMVGKWTWKGQSCADGPRIAYEAKQLVFTTISSRFVHRIVSDDASTLRTEVLSPSNHSGEGYRFWLAGDVLHVFEAGTKEENVWTRCSG